MYWIYIKFENRKHQNNPKLKFNFEMGIKNLSKFVSTKYPNIIQSDSIDILTKNSPGKIAVDISQLLFRHKSGAIKQVVDNTFFHFNDGKWTDIDREEVKNIMSRYLKKFIRILREFKIEPLFVFDGKAPELKKKTREARQKVYDKSRENLEESRKKDDVIESVVVTVVDDTILKYDIIETDNIGIDDVSDEINDKDISNDKIIKEETTNEMKYRKSLKRFCFPTSEEIQMYRDILISEKCSIVQAEGEAEGVCCYFCKMDFVQGVYSNDFDLFAYGDVIMIKEININLPIPTMKYIYSDVLEQVLELDRNQMLEYCIMCGTDYNKNITGFSSVKCLELMKEYNSLDIICQNKEEFKEFNFIHVKELFLSKPKYKIIYLSDVYK